MRVIIHPAVDVFYYSYYIDGLCRLFGRKNVKFCTKGFPKIEERNFAALLITADEEKKIIIDAFDTRRINKALLQWCDVYGKVNLDPESLPEIHHEKIIPIGPSFGIRIWSLPYSICIAASNYFKVREQVYFKRNFVSNYWRQYKRLPLKDYLQSSETDRNYIFFVSSLWEKETETNSARAEYIKACRELDTIDFEGGFAPRTDGKDLGYKNFIFRRIGLSEYIKKLKKSLIAFNTPAVVNCHGWKLAEFMAMGKAIISTPLTNTMPVEIIHGREVYFLKDASKNEIMTAINKIEDRPAFRKHLEINSRKYFMEVLHPEKVWRRLLDHVTT